MVFLVFLSLEDIVVVIAVGTESGFVVRESEDLHLELIISDGINLSLGRRKQIFSDIKCK